MECKRIPSVHLGIKTGGRIFTRQHFRKKKTQPSAGDRCVFFLDRYISQLLAVQTPRHRTDEELLSHARPSTHLIRFLSRGLLIGRAVDAGQRPSVMMLFGDVVEEDAAGR